MQYQNSYLEAMARGDKKTMRAIERLNRGDYSADREGYNQEERDRIRATFGDAYEGFYYYDR